MIPLSHYLILGAGHELVDAAHIADFLEHVQYRLVGAAVGWSCVTPRCKVVNALPPK